MKRVRKDIEVLLLYDKKVSLRVDPQDTIKSLMQTLVDKHGCDFIYGYLTIDHGRIKIDNYEKTIDQLNIVSKLVYHQKITGGPKGVLWSNYIESTSISPYQRKVVWKPSITIRFKSFSPFGEKRWSIDTQHLAKWNRCNDGTKFQNHWTSYWDPKYDRDYLIEDLHVFPWEMPNILLIALNDNVESLEDIRYNIYGCNKSYCGGEYYSWHRYTYMAPFVTHFYPTTKEITIVSHSTLTPNRWYAWVLLHTPRGTNPPIYDDYIIPFLANDCSKCQQVIWTFLMFMRRMGDYMYSVGKLVCREYVWPERFHPLWEERSDDPKGVK